MKLSKSSFSVKCFTAEFLQFSNLTVKIFFSFGQLGIRPQFQ